jgi:hypothetical protein
MCNGTCTDLQIDSANCGACGNPCPAGEVCQDGICATDLECVGCSSDQACCPPGGCPGNRTTLYSCVTSASNYANGYYEGSCAYACQNNQDCPAGFACQQFTDVTTGGGVSVCYPQKGC